MKLSYLQSTDNPFDPLPKLGRKVEPVKPKTAEQIRREDAEEFERGSHFAVKPLKPSVDLDLSKPESWPVISSTGATTTTPPVVSFADAAEMAEAKRAPTLEDYCDAFYAARANHSLDEIAAVICPLLEAVGHKPGDAVADFPQAFPFLIAALEALQ
jgi:hypothetical protein